MAVSIGKDNLRLIAQIQDSKDLYIKMAKGTSIENRLEGLYATLTIAFRKYASSITTVYLETKSRPVTNIYMENGKVTGVDHRDYEKEYWDKQRSDAEAQKPIIENDLLRALREIDDALNSVPEIKVHKEKGIENRKLEELKKSRQDSDWEDKMKVVAPVSIIGGLVISIILGFIFGFDGFGGSILALILWVVLSGSIFFAFKIFWLDK